MWPLVHGSFNADIANISICREAPVGTPIFVINKITKEVFGEWEKVCNKMSGRVSVFLLRLSIFV